MRQSEKKREKSEKNHPILIFASVLSVSGMLFSPCWTDDARRKEVCNFIHTCYKYTLPSLFLWVPIRTVLGELSGPLSLLCLARKLKLWWLAKLLWCFPKMKKFLVLCRTGGFMALVPLLSLFHHAHPQWGCTPWNTGETWKQENGQTKDWPGESGRFSLVCALLPP